MADRITVRFARFLSPGSFVAEDWTKPVNSLDPYAVEWPENAYAFSLYERTDIVDGPDTFTGEAKQIGPLYYHPDSKVESLEEARNNPNSTRILLQNMRCNGWGQIVWTRWGNWPQPFDRATCEVLATRPTP